MKAVVFHGIGDIRTEEVDKPRLLHEQDAIVKITASAICGTDLHFVRGTMAGLEPGTILGHEGVGIVEEVGDQVRNLRPGDRVVIPSTIACGSCSYCRAGYFAQCDVANPNGEGTAFFGGPVSAGGFDGLQAEYARIPFANVGLVKLPDSVSDDQALPLSDIFPTAWFGAKLAEIKSGDTVAVFGCGPVGQFAIASAKLQGASRVIAIDTVADRLAAARDQGAEVIDFNADDPVETIKSLTMGIGVDRVIDAVGIDAERPHDGPAASGDDAKEQARKFDEEVAQIAPEQHHDGENWVPGDGPSQVLDWAVKSVAKAGTIALIGVYPPTAVTFPIGEAMNKNLTINMGNCNHRKYIPELVELVRTGAVDPSRILSQHEHMSSAIEAYEAFDLRRPGWMKVELEPAVH